MKLVIRRRTCQLAGGLLGAIALLALVFVLLQHLDNAADAPQHPHPTPLEEKVVQGVRYLPNEHLQTVLLIGVDKAGTATQTLSYNNDRQADFLLLAIVDTQQQCYSLLHLNRDTMAQIPMLGVRGEYAGSCYAQLALAHTYGSGALDSDRNTAQAVQALLGVAIDHTLSLPMDAVPALNDLLGGVRVTLQEDLQVLSPAWRKGETVTLHGEEALTFVRARGALQDSSNLQRMTRQQQYLQALQTRLVDCATQEDFYVQLLATLAEYMQSDCTTHQLSELYTQLTTYTFEGLTTLPGACVQAQPYVEFHVEEDALQALIVDLFYRRATP